MQTNTQYQRTQQEMGVKLYSPEQNILKGAKQLIRDVELFNIKSSGDLLLLIDKKLNNYGKNKI